MKEYLKMDDELPFEEFTAYAQDFLAYLGANFDSSTNDELLVGRFILSILQGNASDRSKRKSPEAKKYKKLAEKCNLWFEAINYRLKKNGLTQAEVDEATRKISDEC